MECKLVQKAEALPPHLPWPLVTRVQKRKWLHVLSWGPHWPCPASLSRAPTTVGKLCCRLESTWWLCQEAATWTPSPCRVSGKSHSCLSGPDLPHLDFGWGPALGSWDCRCPFSPCTVLGRKLRTRYWEHQVPSANMDGTGPWDMEESGRSYLPRSYNLRSRQTMKQIIEWSVLLR